MTVGALGSDFIKIKKSRLTPLELWALTTDEPLVKTVEFDEEQRLLLAEMRDGDCCEFPLQLFPELAQANDEQIHDVTTLNMGAVLQWTELDVHYAVKALVERWQSGDWATPDGISTVKPLH